MALAFSLVLRTIPAAVGLAEVTRAAARARGLERDVRARLIPFAIRVVADAHATGEVPSTPAAWATTDQIRHRR